MSAELNKLADKIEGWDHCLLSMAERNTLVVLLRRAASHDAGMLETVPEGIYFSIDNFYDAKTLRGCGWKFYRKWSHRWSEFPLSAEAALAPQELEAKPAATVDSVPSCGSENDYRNARPERER